MVLEDNKMLKYMVSKFKKNHNAPSRPVLVIFRYIVVLLAVSHHMQIVYDDMRPFIIIRNSLGIHFILSEVKTCCLNE